MFVSLESRSVRRMSLTRLYARVGPGVAVPNDYDAGFERAVLTFRHQRVFDPRSQTIVSLTPLPPERVEDDVAFLGPMLPSDQGIEIASGKMHPTTLQPFGPDILHFAATAATAAPDMKINRSGYRWKDSVVVN